MEVAKKVILRFTAETVEKPIVYTLAKEYDLISNILRAEIKDPNNGRVALELRGESDDFQKGLRYLESIGVQIEPLEEELVWHEELCTHCGACVGLCRPGALSMDYSTYTVSFDSNKCILCQQCLQACSFKAVEVAI